MAMQELQERFPRMKPVKNPPPMFRLHGCGISLYGRRDSDPETQTYVATLCVAIVFVPVICLLAYRVAKARGGGWYFIGREPLSMFAKAWNATLVLIIAGAIGGNYYQEYTTSPAYKAKQQMAAAHKAAEQGQLATAASNYQSLALGNEQAANATAALKGLVDNECKQASLEESCGVMQSAVVVARQGHGIAPDDVSGAAMKLVADKGDGDPKNAVRMLDIVRPLILDTRALDDRKEALLQKWATADPGNLAAIVPLASILLEREKVAEAKKLLLPVKDKLGDGDGARVLGMILGREGDYDGAYALLWPYVKTRLDTFHTAEKNLDDTWKRIQDREIDNLDQKRAPQSFYDHYENANKQQQQQMVMEYITNKAKGDQAYVDAQASMERETAVVPVALDLGIVMLQRAQGQSDPKDRKKQLESAEQVFLAIGGVAGQSDEYRLSLGEVDYWLGKQTDGRKLFDDYLSTSSRGFTSLLAVATRLRRLGAQTDARAMAEEAYTKTQKPEEQHQAAVLRSTMSKDPDDEIAWLNKCDTALPQIKGKLAQATGEKAFNEGRDDEAANQYRTATAAYGAMPRSATALNEAALAEYGLFLATGDRASLDRCVGDFQQAVDLEPSDSILLFNAGETLRDAAISDVIGNRINLGALHQIGSLELLAHLYSDDAGRTELANRIKQHPGMARALSYLQKAMVLAPKNIRSYESIFTVHRFTRNDAALAELEQRLKSADLDTGDEAAIKRDFENGTRDQQDRQTITAAINRNQDKANSLRAAGGVTASVAICDQAGGMLALEAYTGNEDLDKALALAEEADRIHHSTATTQMLISAHLNLAARRLRGSDAQFAAFYKKEIRVVGIYPLMAAAASETSAYQSAVANDADVKKAVELIIAQNEAFPKDASAYEWALLRGVNSPAAAKTADAIRANPRNSLLQSIESTLHPFNPASAMESYWLMTLLNKPDEAREVLKKAADGGSPLPIHQ